MTQIEIAVYTIIFILIAFIIALFAVIYFSSRRARRAKKRHDEELSSIYGKIEHTRMDLENVVTMLSGLHDFDISLGKIASKKELCKSIVEAACKLMRSQHASIMLIDADNNELYITASKGLPQEVADNIRIKISEGVSGKVVQTGEPIFVKDVESDIRFLRPNSSSRYETKSFVCMPLKVKGKIIGVLNASASHEIKNFEDRDVKLLAILADQAAISIENMDLYTKLDKFYFEMVQTLARAVDAKDSYTHDHSDRASYYAKRIAQKMNLPEVLTRHVEFAALMHDIGKIGIDENILKKNGKLNEQEMEIIKKHPAIGNKIISPVAFLAPIAPIVLYHQEWFNGKGYPEGLKGEEIPLGSRIVAVIDAYDAMTSDRPYRKALTKEHAVTELRNCAGSQFDPNVVEAFVEVLINESGI